MLLGWVPFLLLFTFSASVLHTCIFMYISMEVRYWLVYVQRIKLVRSKMERVREERERKKEKEREKGRVE